MDTHKYSALYQTKRSEVNAPGESDFWMCDITLLSSRRLIRPASMISRLTAQFVARRRLRLPTRSSESLNHPQGSLLRASGIKARGVDSVAADARVQARGIISGVCSGDEGEVEADECAKVMEMSKF